MNLLIFLAVIALVLEVWGNDDLGPPISPEEFVKAWNDSTLTAPPPEGANILEEEGQYQGDIMLTPKQRAHMSKVWRNDDLGPPISPEEFVKAWNDSTLTAPPPEGANILEEEGQYQGDIMLTPKQRAQMRKGRIASSLNYRLWVNGVIPYTISSVYTEEQRQVIARAMDEFHARTCLKFIGRTDQTDYIHIMSKGGCSSFVGRIRGRQELSLRQNGCVYFNTAIHELMHAAGVHHEQTRNDRDNYITVNWENIKDTAVFLLEKEPTTHGLGLPYDYLSRMHYGTGAYSKNGQPTMTLKEEGVTIRKGIGLSELDVKGLNLLYKCEDAGSCAGGVSIGGQCLVFSQGARNWEEARTACEIDGNKLASLADPDAVLAYTKGKYANVRFYVGGSDAAEEGTWQWLNNKPISIYPSRFPWLSGEPNNYGGIEDCLEINLGGGFNDLPCSIKKRYICSKGNDLTVENCDHGVSIGGQCLVFSQEVARTGEKARAACETDGNKLASLADPDAVLAYTKGKYGNVRFYVGGSDAAEEGTWKWLNDQPISSDPHRFPEFPWLSGEPNDLGDEHCLEINFRGGFNDISCWARRRFICEVV